MKDKKYGRLMLAGLAALTGFVTICHANTIGAPYVELAGGYEKYQHAYSNDGNTGVARIAFGTTFPISCATSLGVEMGIQTGNRMRLETDDVASDIGSLPVFLNIKPPIDLLAVAKYHYNLASFVAAKLGVAYLNGMVDSTTINNKNQLAPELQLGAGWDISERTSLVLYYQGIFSGSPHLTIDNPDQGTAKLHDVATSQGIFVGIEMHL